MSTAVEIARAFEAAWQGSDFETARGYLADDLVFDSPFGQETNPDAVVGQYTGFMQVVTGPAREIAAFGDGVNALLMSRIPSFFGEQVNAAHYVVREGKISLMTLVYDATAAKTQVAAQQPA
jgi:hypothetical protein